MGSARFHRFFSDLYGARWEELSRSLRDEVHYATINLDGEHDYHLDEGSLIACDSLGPISGNVLDLCSAPGGKCLALLRWGNDIDLLTANDRSRTRRDRLRRVLTGHLSGDALARVRITGHDATLWYRYERNAYDFVMLDVPCSGERHLLNNPEELDKWSESRTKRLAAQSFAMLTSALEVVRPGGRVLFCTCTVSPFENDRVVAKLLKRRPGRFRIGSSRHRFGEETEFGRLILPDTSGGKGPTYFSIIERTS